MSKYPTVGRIDKKPKNTSAKCGCGEIGKFKSHVEVSYMRGDDVVVWSCDAHKKNSAYLLNRSLLDANQT